VRAAQHHLRSRGTPISSQLIPSCSSCSWISRDGHHTARTQLGWKPVTPRMKPPPRCSKGSRMEPEDHRVACHRPPRPTTTRRSRHRHRQSELSADPARTNLDAVSPVAAYRQSPARWRGGAGRGGRLCCRAAIGGEEHHAADRPYLAQPSPDPNTRHGLSGVPLTAATPALRPRRS
jgi:hypothetical protein